MEEKKKGVKKRAVKRVKKDKNVQKKKSTVRNIILIILVLIIAGTGAFLGREYYLKKNLDLARENLRQYPVSVLSNAVKTAVENVKTDAARSIDTANGLQEAWQLMWPEEVEITDANRDDESVDNFSLGCGYALLLASDIERNNKGKIKFINRGNSGDRITDVYARIKEDIINLRPDYMSILIGVNDVAHELTMSCGVTAEKFEKIYSMLIEEIKEALPQIKIIIMEPFVLKGSATEKLWDGFKSEVKAHGEAARRVAEKYSLPFVELQNKFDEASADGDTRYWSVDGVHPSAAGHQIIKEELTKAILEVV